MLHATTVEAIWTAINSPVGISVVAGVILLLLNRLYAARPGWAQFEGTIISAIKFAEQAIPDETSHKSAARLNAAADYVLKVYEEIKGRRAPNKVIADLREGIQITHNKLEAEGTIK